MALDGSYRYDFDHICAFNTDSSSQMKTIRGLFRVI